MKNRKNNMSANVLVAQSKGSMINNQKKYKNMMEDYDGLAGIDHLEEKFAEFLYEFSKTFHLCIKLYIIQREQAKLPPSRRKKVESMLSLYYCRKKEEIINTLDYNKKFEMLHDVKEYYENCLRTK